MRVLAELAAERPVDRVGIVDVAERARVSRPTVVRHLGNKRALRGLIEGIKQPHGPESVRESIVGAALADWGSFGEGPPSIARLAERTGLAKSSVGWHFPHKADLLVAIAQQLAEILYDTSSLWGGESGSGARGAARELRQGVESLLRRRIDSSRRMPRASAANAWLRRAGPEAAHALLDAAERGFRRRVAEWLRALALRGELQPGADIEAWIALLETLVRGLEQRVGQQSWPERVAALLVAGLARR